MKYYFTLVLLLGAFISYAQKIPFQGKLTDNGDPVSADKTFVFSIESADWSETHTNVAVLDGFYSVVLGSENPLPLGLFDESDEVQLSITVDDTNLSPITIYAPFKRNLNFPIDLTTTGIDTSFVIRLSGETTGNGTAMKVESATTGTNYAISGSVKENSDNANTQYGVTGAAAGTGSGSHLGVLGSAYNVDATGGNRYGVFGQAASQAKYNYGTYGLAQGPGNGDAGEGYGVGSINFGAYGYAAGNEWSNTGAEAHAGGSSGAVNYGVHGLSEAGTSDTVRNHGVAGRAFGPGINYGVYGSAFDGAENWAGWFDGDVNINGALMVNGEPLAGGEGLGASLDSIESKDIKLLNESGNMRANLNIYNDAGSLVLNSPNDSTKAILGSAFGSYGSGLYLYDSLRNYGARLSVDPKGVGNLYTYDANHKVSGWLGNASGTGGFMQLAGYGEGGAFTGATYTGMASWDNGLPYFIMEGSSEDPFTTLVEFGANGDGSGGEFGYFRLNTNQRVLDGQGSATVFEIDHATHLPFIQLSGGNDLNWDARVRLSVDSIGSLGTAGALSLLGPVGNENSDPMSHFEVRSINDPGGSDPNGASAEMFMWGDSSPNFQIGGKPWEENDFASFGMYGSHDDGNGWYQANLNMSVYQAANYQSVDINLRNTQAGGLNVETIQIMSNMYDNNGGGVIVRDSTGATTVELVGQTGEVNAVTVNQSSDRRLKENIKAQENSLEKVKSLRGVTFEWKEDHTNDQNIGFIAQEVEEVYPEVVTTKENGYKAVNYAVLVSALVEAVKELDAKVSSLETENSELKAQLTSSKSNAEDINALKSEIASIKKILSLSVEQNQSGTVGQSK